MVLLTDLGAQVAREPQKAARGHSPDMPFQSQAHDHSLRGLRTMGSNKKAQKFLNGSVSLTVCLFVCLFSEWVT